ncbi:MAG: ABC transporter ATP-binding protein [Candidatus Bathyarchaeia archaeon]
MKGNDLERQRRWVRISGSPAAGGSRTILEMRNITKRFPGVVANDHINFDLRAGEIHCILGENGAGKTTLMNILYGLYRMDEGEILADGKNVSIRSPKDAINLGIGMIHQFFTLVPGLTVMENIILGREPTKGPFLDRKRAEKEILELQGKFNLKVDLDAKPEQLSAGEKQRVEILKALYQGARILIMDEPTSVLTPQEKKEFMRSLREMTQKGISSVVFITHKLPEAMAVSDRITIIRKGKVVDVLRTKGIDRRELAQKVVGRKVSFHVKKGATRKGRVILEVKGVKALGDTGVLALKGVSLLVRGGEILGIAGVSGNGQEELVEVIAGQRRAIAGKVLIKGEDVTNCPPRKVRDLKVGYIPESRIERGILPDLSIGENAVLGIHSEPPFAHRWLLPFDKRWFTNPERMSEYGRRLAAEYNVDTPSIDKPAGKLSGGNIQKLILARELSRNPDLLLADKPTSGLDVGSQEFVRQRLIREREKGKAILLVSEDLDEIIMMSDRIAVMYEGKIVAVVQTKEATKEKIGAMMTGESKGIPHTRAVKPNDITV